MELIFGNEKELIKEYKFLINEVLPSLNACNFCNKLKCKYCKKKSVNCNMCRKDICLNCKKFDKSKDILINSDNKIISDYVKNFLYEFFSISDLSISFLNFNIDVNNSKNINDISVFGQLIKSNNFPKKEEKIFYCKSKKIRHYCKIFLKKV